MVNFSQLFALAAFGSGIVSAVHIDFKRYADDNCDKKHHIRKTSDLHDTTCKTFSHHELGFRSFWFDVTKKEGDLDEKDCRIVVYPERDCHGEGVTYGNMKDMEKACATLPIEGRSVKVECGKKKDPVVKTLSPKPQPATKTVKVKTTTKPTVTVTHTHHDEHQHTMTVVPKKRVKHCQYDSDDDWE